MSSQKSQPEGGAFAFLPKHKSLTAILTDHNLAALGDAYVNFLYSLILSKKMGKPVGEKVNSTVLASALRMADLRKFLSSRTDRHKQADAAEALIVYGWLVGAVSFDQAIRIMEKEESEIEAFNALLRAILKNLKEAEGKI
jgi:hypothetical protein